MLYIIAQYLFMILCLLGIFFIANYFLPDDDKCTFKCKKISTKKESDDD